MIRLLIPTGAMLAVIALIAASVSLDGQGMASPKSAARGSDLAHTALPVPKVWFEDIAARAGLNFRHVTGDAANKTYRGNHRKRRGHH
jgi:hypothetical protein